MPAFPHTRRDKTPFSVTARLKDDASRRLFYDNELLGRRRAEGLSSQSSEGLLPQHPAPTSARLNDYYRYFIEKTLILPEV
jgi:hypothetical protein